VIEVLMQNVKVNYLIVRDNEVSLLFRYNQDSLPVIPILGIVNPRLGHVEV
jgi:hypothetical protein